MDWDDVKRELRQLAASPPPDPTADDPTDRVYDVIRRCELAQKAGMPPPVRIIREGPVVVLTDGRTVPAPPPRPTRLCGR